MHQFPWLGIVDPQLAWQAVRGRLSRGACNAAHLRFAPGEQRLPPSDIAKASQQAQTVKQFRQCLISARTVIGGFCRIQTIETLNLFLAELLVSPFGSSEALSPRGIRFPLAA